MDSTFFDQIIERRGTGCIKYDLHPAGAREDLIPLWVADMDFPCPPTVSEALAARARHGIYGYGSDEPAYFRAVQQWFETRHGFRFQARDVIPVPGVVFGLSVIVRALTAPGDPIMISQPVYHPFPRIIEANGRRTVINQLVLKENRYQFDFAALEAQIVSEGVKAYLLCSPHNPVGRVWSRGELETLAGICLRHGVLMISDEIHCDFVHEGHKHTPLASLSEEAALATVTCTAPSKTFNLAGLQGSNLIVQNEEYRKKIREELSAMGCHGLNVMAATAGRVAYETGAPWLEALLVYLQQGAALVREGLGDVPLTLLPLEGTYLGWLDCRALGLTPKELDQLCLEKAGLWLQNGRDFGLGGDGFLRWNLACPHSVLREAVERLRRALN